MKALMVLIIFQLHFWTPEVSAGGNIPFMFFPLGNCPNFTQVFTYTGADQNFVVPVGCETITVKAWGAGGGGGGRDTVNGANGGGGAYATSSISVMGNETLTIRVPGGGAIGGSGLSIAGGVGGFGGGGAGGNSGNAGASGSGAGGGGAARTLRGATELTVAAGGAGGGGAGNNQAAGAGGAGGQNGSNNAAGTAAGGTTGTSGATNGSVGATGAGDGGGGGGGGGGTNGGSGGAFGAADTGGGGGGGGASFVGAAGVTGSIQAGAGTTPPNITDADYVGGIGVGGAGGNPPVAGGNGRIVISYTAPLPFTDDGVVFWLDGKFFGNKFSDTACTVAQTTTNGPVGCWRDRKANINVAAPAVGNRPTLNLDGSLLFTPAGTSEMNSAAQVLNGNLNNVVVFSIVSALAVASSSPFNLNYPSAGCGNDPSAANSRYSLHFIWNDSLVYYDFGGCYNPRATEALAAPQTNTIVTLSYQNSGATPQMLARRNGTQILTRAVAVAANFNNGRIGLGDGLNDNAYMNGNIGEMIIVTRPMTNAEMERYEGYLACKWGLQGSLPAGHTFKNVCP
jgi:hypothetical protein